MSKPKFIQKKTGKSLSDLIESYLQTIIETNSHQKISPKLKKIVGSVKLPKNFNEKEKIQSYFETKHK